MTQFVHTKEFGTLYYDFVILEDPEPEFFIAKDVNNNHYLVVMTAQPYVYVMTKISVIDIYNLITGKISMAAPFKHNSSAFIIDYTVDNPEVSLVATNSLTTAQIPADTSFLKHLNKSRHRYLDELAKQIDLNAMESTCNRQSNIITLAVNRFKNFYSEQFWEGYYA